ncbi:hypothetical protein LTR64_008365 [Lithohypha guttulata]|uniref:uncharacterized protein n=1 Tax=Lithohypha guttulata TaxID=1690604 RepID=UPI002DE0A70D|nr:hypothetical protein LTR51_008589 [Lithohypha guttulata]
MPPYLDTSAPSSPKDSSPPLPSFKEAFPHFYEDPNTLPHSFDPFTVNAVTGFLPTALPIKDLPATFSAVQKLVEVMPVQKLDGAPGLLGTYTFGEVIDSGEALLDLTEHIDELRVAGTGKLDLHVITALFRDYSFLASGYLLEPCWKTWNERRIAGVIPDGSTSSYSAPGPAEYGYGRSKLPACIARPLVKLAEILAIPPFMSYAASYALYNYYLEDPALGHEVYDNIRLVRAFEKGLDPASSEAGFILTHVHMVSLTGPLIKGVVEVMDGIEILAKSGVTEKTKQVSKIEEALSLILAQMSKIEANMERMWANSRPKDYTTYRTFIFGITSQPLFPDGVVYEGCFGDKPVDFRGESGANDSIIPLLDNLCQVPMPKNPLTDILREFREYRPESQRSLLNWTESKANILNTRSFLTTTSPRLAILYLRVLNHIRSFRWRHWMFVREYIIKRTKYPVATGGSPIVTWLPNQLSAVMELMEGVYRDSGLMALVEEGMFHGGGGEELEEGVSGTEKKVVKEIMEVVEEQKARLEKEVRKYCMERGV